MELDAKEQLNEHSLKSAELEAEQASLQSSLKSLESEAGERSSNLAALKSLLEDRNAEVSRLRRGLVDLGEEESCAARARRALEEELKAAQNGRIVAERQRTSLMELRERLNKTKEVEQERIRAGEQLSIELDRRLVDLQGMIDEVEKECERNEMEIEDASQLRRQAKEEADSLLLKNSRLQSDKEKFIKKIEDLELQCRAIDRKLGDASMLIAGRDKELESIRSNTAYTENKVLAATEELRKLKSENETLEALLSKYRNDVEFHKRLRDEETIQKYRLEEERKRLSRETLLKDIEAQTARTQLQRYQDSHSQLLEQNSLAAQELQAIKDHAALLESQNLSVRRCSP